jgi:hypothetical protein
MLEESDLVALSEVRESDLLVDDEMKVLKM